MPFMGLLLHPFALAGMAALGAVVAYGAHQKHQGRLVERAEWQRKEIAREQAGSAVVRKANQARDAVGKPRAPGVRDPAYRD